MISLQAAHRREAHTMGKTKPQLPGRPGVTALYVRVSTDFQFVPVSDVTNGISSLTKDDGNSRPKGIYTIDGRKVDTSRSLPRGIYIVDGKKVVVR
jgi:hypothetical protein